MKNRRCPNSHACYDFDASNCEDCAVGKFIEKQKRKIDRLTTENERLRAENAKIDEYKCVIDDISEQCRELEADNKQLRTRLQNAVELPYRYLEMLKLLTCASMCYAEIKDLITKRMSNSKDIADLFLHCPTVQGTTLDFALYDLAKSNINCNKIKGFEDVINATGTFKDYLLEAEAKLKEIEGKK